MIILGESSQPPDLVLQLGTRALVLRGRPGGLLLPAAAAL